MADFNLKIGEPSPPGPADLKVGRSLAQILIVLVVLLVLVNLPLGNTRTGLAQLVPQTSALVIRDGVMLKGQGPEIYRVEDYKLRRIESEAHHYYWPLNKVVTVDDSLLAQFGQGQPIRRLIKCANSPTIYALENGQKRWVFDPPPAGRPWDKAFVISCTALSRLPDGPPIPEDAGLPPQP